MNILVRSALCLAAVCFLIQSPVSGQNYAAQIDSIAQSYVDTGDVAGMSVTVRYKGETIVSRGYGHADLELGVAMPDNAVFSVGSITKQFSSVGILQLVEQGKLDLKADMSEYLPDYPMMGRKVTLRQLLDHTSGIQGFTEMPEFGTVHPDISRDSVTTIFSSAGFWHEPAAQSIYNNSAFFLLGDIIEGASGIPYEKYLTKKIFKPLGMRGSHYCSNTRIVRNRAQGYSMSDDGLVHAAYLNYQLPYAAGSVCSTSEDLVSWMEQLHGGKVLSAASYAELIEPGRLSDGTRTRYAAGVELQSVLGHDRIGHGGGINGFLSASGYFPNDDLYIVVLINTTGPVGPDKVTEALVLELLGDATPPVSEIDFDVDPFLGEYEGTDRGGEATVTIAHGEDGLTIEGRNPVTALEYVGEHTFRVPGTALLVRFVSTPEGAKRLHLDTAYNYSVFRPVAR